MRKAIFAIATLATFALSATAWAIVDTSATLKDPKTGEGIQTQTVVLEVKTEKRTHERRGEESRKTTSTTKRTVLRKKTKTDRNGVVTLSYDEKDVPSDATIDITVRTNDGRVLRRRGLLLSEFHGTIDDFEEAGVHRVPIGPRRADGFQPYMESGYRIPHRPISDHWTGLFIAGSLIINSADLGITEKSADTGETTFQSNGSNTAVGGGISILFTPAFIGGGTAIFMSFDFPNTKAEHVFAGGSSIGEIINFILSGGIQFPLWPLQPYMPRYFQLYGLAGVALVDKDFHIFGSTDEQWLWGGTLGLGIMYSGPELRGWRAFAQYQHIWVERGDVRMPLSSPGFNYSFDNEMDLVKLGLAIDLGGRGPLMSDIRLKHDIELVARLENGLGLYRYRYLWSDTEYVGVMAQEVADVVPDAVLRGDDGYLRVDYGRLGLNLMTWEQWLASTGERFRAMH